MCTIIAYEVNKLTKFYKNRISGKIKCFVIDAFRNPIEVEYFSRRYEQFYLVSLSCDKTIRQYRFKSMLENEPAVLINEDSFAKQFDVIDQRDWGDNSSIKEQYKQNVSRCAYLADISIFLNLRLPKQIYTTIF